MPSLPANLGWCDSGGLPLACAECPQDEHGAGQRIPAGGMADAAQGLGLAAGGFGAAAENRGNRCMQGLAAQPVRGGAQECS